MTGAKIGSRRGRLAALAVVGAVTFFGACLVMAQGAAGGTGTSGNRPGVALGATLPGPAALDRMAREYRERWENHPRGQWLLRLLPVRLQPSQLPETYNKLQELKLDVRHRLTARLAATAMYQYEPFRVFDFALDPSVVDGIVQPSSLVLGYVYRPYTAHSAVLGLLYFW